MGSSDSFLCLIVLLFLLFLLGIFIIRVRTLYIIFKHTLSLFRAYEQIWQVLGLYCKTQINQRCWLVYRLLLGLCLLLSYNYINRRRGLDSFGVFPKISYFFIFSRLEDNFLESLGSEIIHFTYACKSGFETLLVEFALIIYDSQII
jgi:hypothetical protein